MDYVEEVIKLLGMQGYAEAIVGVPSEGNYARLLRSPRTSAIDNEATGSLLTSSSQVSTSNSENA